MTACYVSQGHLSLITQLSTNYSLTSFTPFPCKSQGSPLKQIGPISCHTIASSRLLKAKNLTHTNKYFCFKTLSSYLAVMAMIFGCYALQKASEFSNKKACFFHQWPEFSEGIFFFKKTNIFSHISFKLSLWSWKSGPCTYLPPELPEQLFPSCWGMHEGMGGWQGCLS